jgi:hypothetical protein
MISWFCSGFLYSDNFCCWFGIVLILCSKGGHLQPVLFPMLPLLLSHSLAFMQHHSRLSHHQKWVASLGLLGLRLLKTQWLARKRKMSQFNHLTLVMIKEAQVSAEVVLYLFVNLFILWWIELSSTRLDFLSGVDPLIFHWLFSTCGACLEVVFEFVT